MLHSHSPVNPQVNLRALFEGEGPSPAWFGEGGTVESGAHSDRPRVRTG